MSQTQKCRGKILDYGIELIDAPNSSLHEMPKAKVKLEITDKEEVENGFKYNEIHWDGLFVNTKGELNKATAKNLFEMGFNGDDAIVLAEGPESESLNMDTLYYVELEVNDKGYWQVKWINREEFSGGVGEIKKVGKEALQQKMAALKIKGDMKKMFEESKTKKSSSDVPNMAPEFNSKEKVPF